MFADKDSKITVQDLLPFADQREKATLMSPETKDALRKLVQKNALPGKVVAAFSKEIMALGKI